ncbi:guanylin-like [Xenopus laevis]|uniref:Guanylate cyclase activator 2B n=1 Tax=Xenopus laevis TaxID=8355 RepID=A0A8J0U5C0_XENLA|nr:guanylin-like [Xenopus laevis]
MRWLCVLVLLIPCATCVIVKDGDFTFNLEDVKKLKEVLDQELDPESRVQKEISKSSVEKVCTNPNLPDVFERVCVSSEARDVFYRLEQIAAEPDVCDVCAFAACSGC